MSSDTVLGTVVICTALDMEYTAVREHLDGPFTERGERGTLYQLGTFPTDRGRWTVALTQTGAGNTQVGIQLDRAIAVFHPMLVLFVGVAGGRKDVALGDVVIADAIYDYESGKATAEDYLPRIKTTAPSHSLLSRARQLARDNAWQHRILPAAPEKPPTAVIKPIAAGSKIIADQNSATAQFLHRHCGDAAAVEMEGHGFLHGAYVNDTVQALVVRGISDLLSGKTETADTHWQPIASRHAAAFAVELLARHNGVFEPLFGKVIHIPGGVSIGPTPDQISKLHDELNLPILAFLVNFDNCLEELGDLEAQLDYIPQGMWPIIDTVAYGQADTFLQRSGLGDVPSPLGTSDVREALAFLLKVAFERGYFMFHFHRLDYIPRPVHPVDPVAIMDLIIAEGDPAHPDRSLGNAIEVTLRRAISRSTEPEAVTRTLQMLGDHLVQAVQPHLDLWCDTVRSAHAYGILAARAETKGSANPEA